MVTGKEMCELISEYLESKGIHKTWEEIWNHSPTGELFWVHEYYERAKKWKRNNMKWINIEEEKPEIGKSVLVFNNDKIFNDEGPYFVCRYYSDNWIILNDTYPNSSNYTNFTPSYWMPLPTPPKE